MIDRSIGSAALVPVHQSLSPAFVRQIARGKRNNFGVRGYQTNETQPVLSSSPSPALHETIFIADRQNFAMSEWFRPQIRWVLNNLGAMPKRAVPAPSLIHSGSFFRRPRSVSLLSFLSSPSRHSSFYLPKRTSALRVTFSFLFYRY